MKASTIQWHLARDNQTKLHKFCQENKTTSVTDTAGKDTFTIRYFFDNGAFILVELLKGTKERSFSVADHFQVVDYSLGRA